MNKLFYTLFAGLALLSLASCKKNNLVVGKDITPPPFVKFSTLGTSDTTASYYIKSSNNTFKIPVGITNVSDKDRTIQFSYTSNSAVQGQQFTAPASIVIPAGKALDSLTITGMFNGYSTPGRIDTLKITITGGDVPVNPIKYNYVVYLRKFCEVIAAQMTGDYTNTVDYYGGQASSQGPYTATVTNWVSTGPTTATAYIINLGFTSDNGWGPFPPTAPASNPGIQVTFDWTNPAAFKATIASQPYFDDGSGISKISTTTGTFSSCDNSITLPCSVLYAGNGKTYVTTTVLKR